MDRAESAASYAVQYTKMESSYPLRPGEPDCRDYLRTGRCKYGESCKYNHPANVEAGGGVKPINPGEPMFPIRPNEPPCQYFLKHGTCKFGQSCKFNHPNGVAEGGGVASNVGLPSGLVFLTTTNASTYTVDANGGLTHSGSAGEVSSLMATPSSVQILPQRPNEPNCIYFLRNGRCKYGPTCKFHHPIETATVDRRMRSNSFSGYGQTTPRLQPITEQRGALQKPTHILLPDGQIAVIIDPQSLQQVNEINVQPKFYVSQTPHESIGTLQSLDQSQLGLSPMLTATTASSAVSSSYQTLESTVNVDMWGNRTSSNNRVQVSNAGGHGSGNSLSAYGSSDESIPSAQRGQYQMSQSQHRQPWSIEINERQQYQHQMNGAPSNEEYEYEESRRRAASFGTSPQPASNHYLSNGSLSLSSQMAYDQRSRFESSNGSARPATNHLRGDSEDGDGLTEMTSALLTMMDRHGSSDEASHNASPGPDLSQSSQGSAFQQARRHFSLSEPNIYLGPAPSPARPNRPPPGMTSLSQAAYQVSHQGSFEHQSPQRNHNASSPSHGGNYIQPSMSPAWDHVPRF